MPRRITGEMPAKEPGQDRGGLGRVQVQGALSIDRSSNLFARDSRREKCLQHRADFGWSGHQCAHAFEQAGLLAPIIAFEQAGWIVVLQDQLLQRVRAGGGFDGVWGAVLIRSLTKVAYHLLDAPHLERPSVHIAARRRDSLVMAISRYEEVRSSSTGVTSRANNYGH
jgi:hypothetical protein